MKKFLKNLFCNFFLSYGISVVLILIISLIRREDISTLTSIDFLLYILILVFLTSIGGAFVFQPELKHINIWLRRLILCAYSSILVDVGIYIYTRYILGQTKSLTFVMIFAPAFIFAWSAIAYYIADKAETKNIKKMNESLKQYNQNNTNGL